MPGRAPKATLLLSHHQYFTAFSDKAYTKPAEQLREFFGDRPVVWLWGHEHRLALYNLNTLKGGIAAYGRCVGHAGMPVETGIPDVSKAPLLRYDARTHQLSDGTVVGENGYVLATLNGAQLSLEYLDIRNTLLWKEVFTAGPNGSLTYNVAADRVYSQLSDARRVLSRAGHSSGPARTDSLRTGGPRHQVSEA